MGSVSAFRVGWSHRVRGMGSWFVEAPGVGGIRNGLIKLTTCQAAIVRTGNDAINEKTLIAFFDGQLPMAYNIARQHARRSAHTTLLAHYTDIQSQVRATMVTNLWCSRPMLSADSTRSLIRVGALDSPLVDVWCSSMVVFSIGSRRCNARCH